MSRVEWHCSSPAVILCFIVEDEEEEQEQEEEEGDIVDGASTSSFNSTLQFTEKMAEIDTDK